MIAYIAAYYVEGMVRFYDIDSFRSIKMWKELQASLD